MTSHASTILPAEREQDVPRREGDRQVEQEDAADQPAEQTGQRVAERDPDEPAGECEHRAPRWRRSAGCRAPCSEAAEDPDLARSLSTYIVIA